MRVFQSAVWAASLFYGTASALADCEDVYRDAVRNRTFTSTDWASLNAVYDRICTASGDKKNFSFNSGAGIVLDYVPMEGTGNLAASEDKWERFCKSYRGLRYDASHSKVVADVVVGDALNSFNRCKEIESKARVVPKLVYSPDSVAITFDFESGAFLQVGGVKTTNLDCQTNDTPKGPLHLNLNSSFEMKGNFSIICTRTNAIIKKNDGSVVYPASSLTIANNVVPYTWNFTEDTLYNNNLASDLQARISNLTTEINSKESDLANFSAIQSRLKNMRVVSHEFTIGDGNNDYPCGTDFSATAAAVCGGVQHVSVENIQRLNGGTCGYNLYRALCVYY